VTTTAASLERCVDRTPRHTHTHTHTRDSIAGGRAAQSVLTLIPVDVAVQAENETVMNGKRGDDDERVKFSTLIL